MQPLAYLAVRALLGWVQLVERADRAFVSSPLVLVAAGAVHCWAVVYSLFVAVHTRAMRVDGYHEGYIEHLPSSVSITETLAVASLWVWLLAGFTTAAVRILDEDSGNLPMGDTKTNPLLKLVRSPMFHSTLGHAHSVSCVGLFVSILMLCITMAFMKGGITCCELCLVIVSFGFALPHALLAMGRLSEGAEMVLEAIIPAASIEGAAAEAAALGPQLCIVLALADAPGHAYMWQNAIYFLTSVSVLAGIASCFRSPPKAGAMALPPETHETFVCLALDAAAGISIVLSYPHLNTWLLWLCAVALGGLAACVRLKEIRDIYQEWLEPVFVVRSDAHKRLPDPQRQLLRRNAWVFGVLCGSTALWDITMHPVPQTGYVAPKFNPANELLMLRWQPQWQPHFSSGQANERLLQAAAATLSVEESALKVEKTLGDHRLLLFRYNGKNASVVTQWREALLSPTGQLGEIADHSFPAVFSVLACLPGADKAKTAGTPTKDEAVAVDGNVAPEAPAEESEEAKAKKKEDEAASAALQAACTFWREDLVAKHG